MFFRKRDRQFTVVVAVWTWDAGAPRGDDITVTVDARDARDAENLALEAAAVCGRVRRWKVCAIFPEGASRGSRRTPEW